MVRNTFVDIAYDAQRKLSSKKVHVMNFKNFNRLLHAPFAVYVDFECVLVPLTGTSYNGSNIEKYQNHIVCSYGYKFVD